MQERANLQQVIRGQALLESPEGLPIPDIMEFDPYIRPQRTVSRSRKTIPTEPTIETPVRPTIKQSNLDQAMKEGKVDLRNPAMAEKWAEEAPEREARQWAINSYNLQTSKLQPV